MRLSEGQTADLIADYMSLFRAANPGRPEPKLSYEEGWFVFRYAHTGLTPDRVRRAQLLEMAERLRMRSHV